MFAQYCRSEPTRGQTYIQNFQVRVASRRRKGNDRRFFLHLLSDLTSHVEKAPRLLCVGIIGLCTTILEKLVAFGSVLALEECE
jgi:hypothetical protein